MDPKACWEQLTACIGDGSAGQARIHARDLIEWLDRGGFSPVPGEREDVIALLRHLYRTL